MRNGGDTELGNQIVQEGAASSADVFLTENSPAMALVEQAKLFAPIPADILAQVPANFRPSSGNWVGIAARSTRSVDHFDDGTQFVWVQEEPENMGAWRHMRVRHGSMMFGRFPFSGVCRTESASPATGSASCHKLEQQELLERAFA